MSLHPSPARVQVEVVARVNGRVHVLSHPAGDPQTRRGDATGRHRAVSDTDDDGESETGDSEDGDDARQYHVRLCPRCLLHGLRDDVLEVLEDHRSLAATPTLLPRTAACVSIKGIFRSGRNSQ